MFVPILLAVTVVYLIYRWSVATFDRFEKINVPFTKPFPLLGAITPYLKKVKSPAEALSAGYGQFPNRRFSGFFAFRTPAFLIHDPELIKQIAIRDFDHFTDHANCISLDVDPFLGRSLFFSGGQRWKQARTALSPAFTGSKMRNMFELLANYADAAMKRLIDDAVEGKLLKEMQDLFKRLSNDVITSISLGVEVDSVHDPNNEFFKYARRLATTSGLQGFRLFVVTILPDNLFKALGLKPVATDIAEFYYKAVSDAIKLRLEKNIVRPDFIHLMLQARRNELKADKSDDMKNTGGSSTTQEDVEPSSKTCVEWTDFDIATQSASFFFGGIDTTSTLLCFTIYELALNPEVQSKLRVEIDNVKKKLESASAKLTYETMQQMKYLDMVVTESLRKWPPFGVTNRRCAKDYKMKNPDGTEVTVQKGEIVFFPIHDIHLDPKYYPNPEKFDPERFSDKNRHNLNQDAYLPFGVGPRICIASRLALMQAKCFLYYLLASFDVRMSERTDVPMQLDLQSAGLNSKNGFWFYLIPRTKKIQ